MGGASTAAILSATRTALAEKKYDEGASDTEIRIGHCCAYSGPASAYGVIGLSHQAFFKAINEAGGINGRKVTFITLDDGYVPSKTVECVRQLVEADKVLLLFQMLGTAATYSEPSSHMVPSGNIMLSAKTLLFWNRPWPSTSSRRTMRCGLFSSWIVSFSFEPDESAT